MVNSAHQVLSSMASKRDLRSETSFSEDLSKDSRILIPEIIGLAYHGVSQEGVDMAKEEVKKRVAKRNNCQNIREKVRKEAGRCALVNKNKSCYWWALQNLPEIRLKAYICKCMEIKI